MSTMVRVTFGQWDANTIETSFSELDKYLGDNPTDILLLPEMPFDKWFCAIPNFERQRWDLSTRLHEEWVDKVNHLSADLVIGTRPLEFDTRNNVAWIYDSRSHELLDIHGKAYLPNEIGFWEANWYDPAPPEFKVIEIMDLSIGFMICTELWFMHHAREYMKQGADLLLVPRSTPRETVDKWVVGGQAASVIAGSFTISSNHEGLAPDGKTVLGGVGFATDPEGNILARTTNSTPWRTIDIDVSVSKSAKTTYPRYVPGYSKF